MTGQATNDGTRGFLRTIRFDQDRPRTATVHYGDQADYKVHLFQRLIRPTSSILPLIKLAKVFHPNFRNQVPSLFYRSTKKDSNLDCSLTSNRSKTPSKKSRVSSDCCLNQAFLFPSLSVSPSRVSNKLFISSSNHSHQHLYSSKNPTRR